MHALGLAARRRVVLSASCSGSAPGAAGLLHRAYAPGGLGAGAHAGRD